MRHYRRHIAGLVSVAMVLLLTVSVGLVLIVRDRQGNGLPQASSRQSQPIQTARLVVNGDILYHDILYTSARKPDGSYDFNPYFTYVKDWIEGADLAIGDFEGTISPDFPLSGYPLFNAPAEAAASMRDVGYDVVDLGHNHILDSQLSGAIQTAQTFQELGLSTIGFYPNGRATDGILYKEVNGITIALLAYAYGFNDMETNLTPEEYDRHMADLDQDKIKADLAEAEERADITLVMPQMGEEYALAPSPEQRALYHQMIDWGADVVLGGHPHVVQPAETIDKDGEQKFIIYSMGNFLSNQRLETLDNIWTERGLLMDITLEKTGDKTMIKTVKAHPTFVWAPLRGTYSQEGFEDYDYRVFVLEDVLPGGRYADVLPPEMQARAETAYAELTDLVNLTWEN